MLLFKKICSCGQVMRFKENGAGGFKGLPEMESLESSVCWTDLRHMHRRKTVLCAHCYLRHAVRTFRYGEDLEYARYQEQLANYTRRPTAMIAA